MAAQFDGNRAAPERILIILLGSIGDVVRALPLLRRIRLAYPRAYIAWAVEPKSQPIVEGHPWLDETIIYDRTGAPWKFLDFLRRIRAQRFDLVLDLQRHLKSGLASLLSRAPVRVGFAKANAKEFNHLFSNRKIEPQPPMRLKLMQYQAFADELGLPAAPVEFGLSVGAADEARADELLAGSRSPMLGVIVGSSWPSRFYFPELTAEAIRRLGAPAPGYSPMFPLLLGGPSEVDFAREVVKSLGGIEALNLVGKTSLRDLVAILARCAAAFGPDCGPMHIAAAVGCPVVSLWGATSPQRSAPWGFDSLALTGAIPCHPCYLRDCPVGRQCMRRIDPGEVAAAVKAGLEAARARDFRVSAQS